MPTTELPTRRDTIERSGPHGWSTGPYVRVGEREDWNAHYDLFAWEIEQLAKLPANPDFTAEQVHTFAWNLAYEATWLSRED